MTVGSDYFIIARRLGLKEYSKKNSNYQSGYLTSLESLTKDSGIVSQVDLGTMEIPLKKIMGTYTHLRSLSFASNFMPILDESEFRSKWESLCNSHLNEGIKNPIKVYEYLNCYYVVEGNKRVSVLKYFGAYSITANVIRLIPEFEADKPEVVLYYEFLKFNKVTKLNSIWFTKSTSFKKLLSMLETFNPELGFYDSKYRYFECEIYNTFREVYKASGGDDLPITTGDAFLEYARIYSIPDTIDKSELSIIMNALIKELVYFEKNKSIDINTSPEDIPQGNVLTAITNFIMPQKKLKVAFVYARTPGSSGWTYCHELGRLHAEEILGDLISTSYIENVSENEDAYYDIKNLAMEGFDVIFTTSPVFRNATLKCALEHPEINFFNCSEHQPYKHLSNYYGRTFEPRFLTGIIAGAMTKTNLLGYAATSPSPEVISCINAFAAGAKMVNPDAKVKIAWTKEWNSHDKFIDADKKLVKQGCDIVSNRNLTIPREETLKYGVYSMLCSMDVNTESLIHHLAAPIWRWGLFYEKILLNLLNNTYKNILDMYSASDRLVNFWWGMESGVTDIIYSQMYVPAETQKLVNIMKKIIVSNDFNIFTGPFTDNKGQLRIEKNEEASKEEILSMDWYLDNVETEIF